MACPKCGCEVHYQYDSGWDDEQCDERLERCAACGEVFDLEDAEYDDDDIPETQPGAPGFDGADAWNAFNGPEGYSVEDMCNYGAACYASGMEAAAKLCDRYGAMTWWPNDARDGADMIAAEIRAAIDKS